MTWDGRNKQNATVHERAEALRQQHQAEMDRAAQRRYEMAGKEKSVTGLIREPLDFDSAEDALGALNVELNEALDDIRQAKQRVEVSQESAASRRARDAERASALRERGA